MRVATVLALATAAAACGGENSDAPDAAPPDAMMGAITVTGRVQYEDRAPQVTGRLGPIMPVPARHVQVALIAGSGQSIAETVAADDGTYTLVTDGVYGQTMHVLVATTSAAAERPVQVKRLDNRVHGFGGPDFQVQANVTADVLVTETSGEAGAFNVYDQLIRAVDRVVALGETPERLTAVWEKGSTDGTYYIPSENVTYLLGAQSDDDGYDDQVILHETGHWFEDTVGRSDSPGGFHDGSPTDPRLAWSEGFSTYWEMAVTGAPIYIDTNAAGGWSQNADTQVTTANINGSLSQLVSEGMVCEILWDLGDAPTSDDDSVAGDHDEALRVQIDYLAVATLRTSGTSGVDLVDFLDGLFMAAGTSSCAPVRSVVTTTHRFPYDYTWSGGSCP